MGSFFIEYRDPLFGVILFFLILFLISALSIMWRVYSTKRSEKSLRKFVKRFELSGLDDEVLWLIENSKEPIPPLKMLASIYLKSGDIQKSIQIYVSLLENLPLSRERMEVMELLGIAYFKAGFLQRSRDIFLEQLKHYPRNKTALTYLMYVYENLGEFKKALDVLESLEEMGADVKKEQGFFGMKAVIQNPSMVLDKKVAELLALESQHPFIFRECMEFFAKNAKKVFWQKVNKENIDKVIDLLWGFQKDEVDFDVVKNIPFLESLYAAKGYGQTGLNSGSFEIEALKAINTGSPIKGDFGFEYICDECKYVYPLYVSRCQNCQTLLAIEPVPIILKKERDEQERDSLY